MGYCSGHPLIEAALSAVKLYLGRFKSHDRAGVIDSAQMNASSDWER